MAQAARGRQTQIEIVRTGGRLFAAHGYHYTSMTDILQAVAVSKGGFYYHFRSKQDLALAVLNLAQTEYKHQFFDPVAATTRRAGRLATLLERSVELHESGQWHYCLLLTRLAQEMGRQEGQLAEQVATTVNWLIGCWEECVHDARTDGVIRDDLDPRVLAELIVSMLFGAVSCRELDDGAIHLKRIIGQIQLMIAP